MKRKIIDNFKVSKSIVGIADSTLKGYDLLISRFNEFVDDKPITEIDVDDIRNFLVNEKEKRNNNSDTLKTKVNILRSFFYWVYREEIINKNPMDKIDQPQTNKRKPEYLSHEDVEKCRAIAEGQDEMMFEVMYSTGIRVSELVNLNWQDINFDKKTITVTGKGNKTREIPISTRSIMLLKRERGKRDNGDYVVRSNFDKRMSRESIYRHMKKLGEKANTDTKVTPVILRHTFATHILEAGIPLDILKNLMGHENIDTTKIYATTQQRNINHHYRKVFR